MQAAGGRVDDFWKYWAYHLVRCCDLAECNIMTTLLVRLGLWKGTKRAKSA